MKATNVTEHSLDVPKAALAAENPIIGTWKLQSLVYEATATGQRSSPFGDHPVGYLSYSPDGRMYAIGVVEDRPKPRDLVPTDEEKAKLRRACSPMQERIRQTVRR
jgi:Lipocalin-like domain